MRHLLALCALASLLCATPASAQTGIFGVSAGATTLDRGTETTVHPSFRAELSLEVAGPVYLGGFVTGVAETAPFGRPSLGGGALVQLRSSWLGLDPHLEGSLARLQLPSEQMGRVSSWATSLGAGVSPSLDEGLRLEFRVNRTWYHGLPDDADVGGESWSGAIGISVDLL